MRRATSVSSNWKTLVAHKFQNRTCKVPSIPLFHQERVMNQHNISTNGVKGVLRSHYLEDGKRSDKNGTIKYFGWNRENMIK